MMYTTRQQPAVENLASLKQQPYIFDILISRIKNSYHS